MLFIGQISHVTNGIWSVGHGGLSWSGSHNVDCCREGKLWFIVTFCNCLHTLCVCHRESLTTPCFDLHSSCGVPIHKSQGFIFGSRCVCYCREPFLFCLRGSCKACIITMSSNKGLQSHCALGQCDSCTSVFYPPFWLVLSSSEFHSFSKQEDKSASPQPQLIFLLVVLLSLPINMHESYWALVLNGLDPCVYVWASMFLCVNVLGYKRFCRAVSHAARCV